MVRTQSSSAGVAGWYSFWKTARSRVSSLASSEEGATVFERRPCRQALEREAALPRAVRGPVLLTAELHLAKPGERAMEEAVREALGVGELALRIGVEAVVVKGGTEQDGGVAGLRRGESTD